MSDAPFYIISVGDKEIKVVEPIRQKRDRFWKWEYWALKEHMTMKQTETWVTYIDTVVMTMDIPIIQYDVQEICSRPGYDELHRDINVRVPLSKMKSYEERMELLSRSWRELLLYPALHEGLIADFYTEITGKEWVLGDSDNG